MTTYDTQADILAAVEAGAMGYLLKDSPEQALHEAVLKKEPSFTEIFETINADVFALQETKLQEGQV